MLERLRRLIRRPSSGTDPRGNADELANRDRDLVLSLAPARIPSWRQLRFLPQVLTNPERRWFRIGWAVTLVGAVLLLIGLGREHIHAVPANGGTLSIGFVGSPQTINPVYARPGTVDYALTKLVYRGLTTINEKLEVTPDIADSLATSTDGKTLTITLRKDELWSDGRSVTANDVKFTYDVLKDTAYRSPFQSSFAPITTEVVDDYTLRLTTTQPSINLLTTLSIGILPQHIWLDASSATITLAEYNIKPVGNGAWRFQNVTKDRSGAIKNYTFIEQKTRRGKDAYVHAITAKFYPDHDSAVEAIRKQSIDLLTNINPNDLEVIGKKALIEDTPINQVVGIWFNQNFSTVLKHAEVRQALALAIDTGYAAQQLGAMSVTHPVLLGYPGYIENSLTRSARPEQAQQLLEQAGWKKNSAGIWSLKKETIKFSLTVPNDPVYVDIATKYVATWKQLGVDASVRSIDPTQIVKDVVRPRQYDALLFGQQYAADGDLFAYWHSSQQKDPGFALAIWSSVKSDQDLQQSHTALDAATRATAMTDFQNIVQSSVPAILLAQSNILIAHAKHVHGINNLQLVTIGDLYSLIPQLYLKTRWAWK